MLTMACFGAQLCVVPVVVIVFAGVMTIVSSTPASGSLATNEVYDTVDESGPDLPDCVRGAICGLVEVNAFGLSTVPLCTCPRAGSAGDVPGPSCPLVWDQEDGRTVAVGAKQYKYCTKPGPIRVCGRGEKAYVSAFVFQPNTFQIVSGSHRLLCYCPPSARYLAPARSEETFEGGMLVISSVHTCNQLPVCTPSMPCKEVTVAASASQVEVKCRCPRPLVCPTLSRDVVPHDNNNYNKGSGYSVNCQIVF